MPRVRNRNAYQHVSDFDKGQIVAYWGCGLSYRSIAAWDGRNPMTVRRMFPGYVYNTKMVAFVYGCIVENAHCQRALVIVIPTHNPAEIGSRVERSQTTVLRICDHWRQEGMTDRRGRSHTPQYTTSREDRQIMCMAVSDRSVTPRTIAQHIESVTHHSVSARTIRRRLRHSRRSARRPLLSLPFTQNHRHHRRQCCEKRRMWVAE
ncbi:transposable element Tcb1 transposase [Trichonephila clavipes]|nr:transposable element Tcb1 transposase [Trichonephila clavipes]